MKRFWSFLLLNCFKKWWVLRVVCILKRVPSNLREICFLKLSVLAKAPVIFDCKNVFQYYILSYFLIKLQNLNILLLYRQNFIRIRIDFSKCSIRIDHNFHFLFCLIGLSKILLTFFGPISHLVIRWIIILKPISLCLKQRPWCSFIHSVSKMIISGLERAVKLVHFFQLFHILRVLLIAIDQFLISLKLFCVVFERNIKLI